MRAGWPVRGQQTVELALVLPVLVAVLAGIVDVSTAYQIHMGAGFGAEAAAGALAGALQDSGWLSAAGPLPSWAVATARAVAMDRAAVLPDDRTEVVAEWDGPASEVVRTYSPYRFEVTLPNAPNRVTVADLRHGHEFEYWQPLVGVRDVSDSYSVSVQGMDQAGRTLPVTFVFPHTQQYLDVTPPAPGAYWAYPWGWADGLAIPLFQLPPFILFPGLAGGPFLPFSSILAGTDQGGWWRPVVARWFLPASPSWSGEQADANGWFWRSAGGTVDTVDTDNVDAGVDRLRGVFEEADRPQDVGPHAYLEGTRTVVVQTDRGPSEAVLSRRLAVTVRVRLRALTPLLAPVLEGRVIERRHVVVVTWREDR